MIAEGVTPRVLAGALLERAWDAIVVGSGIGGLACAALLAERSGMRVLVLEKHYEVGGLTQTFRRGPYRFEVGVHYVGDVATGLLRRVLDLTCGGRVAWARMPERHDRLIAPGLDVRVGGDRAAVRAQWLAACPGEERAVDAILEAVHECARAAPHHLFGRLRKGPPSTRAPFLRWSDRTAAEVIAESGASPRLALLATYPWTNFGARPELASFAVLAITLAHYWGGAFYPVGGGGRLSHAMAATLAERGGATVVCADVARAIVRDGRVQGVVLRDGTEVRAPIVVSDVGARGTFDWLAPEDEDGRASAHAIGPSGTYLGVYAGLDRAPSACGLDGVNQFVMRDAPEAIDWSRVGDPTEARDPAHVFVSSVCAVDPSLPSRMRGRSVLSLAAPLDLSHVPPRDDEGYERLKGELAARVIEVARRSLPELGAIDALEVSTPRTNTRFTNHASGEIYGLAPTPLRFRRGPGPHTAIEGLFLTGQDVWTGGVLGATLGAMLAASAITRRDLMTELALDAGRRR